MNGAFAPFVPETQHPPGFVVTLLLLLLLLLGAGFAAAGSAEVSDYTRRTLLEAVPRTEQVEVEGTFLHRADLRLRMPEHFALRVEGSALDIAYDRDYESGNFAFRLFGGEGSGAEVRLFGRSLGQWEVYLQESLALMGAMASNGHPEQAFEYVMTERWEQYISDVLTLADDLTSDLFPTQEVPGGRISAGRTTIAADGEAFQLVELRVGKAAVYFSPVWVRGKTNQTIVEEMQQTYPQQEDTGLSFATRRQNIQVYSRDQLAQFQALGVEGRGFLLGVLESTWTRSDRSYDIRSYLDLGGSPVKLDANLDSDAVTRQWRFESLALLLGPRLAWKSGRAALALGAAPYTWEERRRLSHSELELRLRSLTDLGSRSRSRSSGEKSSEAGTLYLVRYGLEHAGRQWGLELAGNFDSQQAHWSKVQLHQRGGFGKRLAYATGGTFGFEHSGTFTPYLDSGQELEEAAFGYEARLRGVVGLTDRPGELAWPWRFRTNPLLPPSEEWFDLIAFPPGLYLVYEWQENGLNQPGIVWATEQLRVEVRGTYEGLNTSQWEFQVRLRNFDLKFQDIRDSATTTREFVRVEGGWRFTGEHLFLARIDAFGGTETAYGLTYIGPFEGPLRLLERLFWR